LESELAIGKPDEPKSTKLGRTFEESFGPAAIATWAESQVGMDYPKEIAMTEQSMSPGSFLYLFLVLVATCSR
jgi:hypothetical protein